MTDLPSPYENGNCVEMSAAMKLKYFKSYSKTACMEECVMKYIINKCNCTDFIRLRKYLLHLWMFSCIMLTFCYMKLLFISSKVT